MDRAPAGREALRQLSYYGGGAITHRQPATHASAPFVHSFIGDDWETYEPPRRAAPTRRSSHVRAIPRKSCPAAGPADLRLRILMPMLLSSRWPRRLTLRAQAQESSRSERGRIRRQAAALFLSHDGRSTRYFRVVEEFASASSVSRTESRHEVRYSDGSR
jgi:hypothetical protein